MRPPLCREGQFAPLPPQATHENHFVFYRKMYVYDNTCFGDASAMGVSGSLSRFFANLQSVKTPASSPNSTDVQSNDAFIRSCLAKKSNDRLLRYNIQFKTTFEVFVSFLIAQERQ